MIKIINVDIKEFKKIIYPEYKKIFSRLERKLYSTLKKNFNNGILKIIYEIENNNVFIGFIMTNSLGESKYIQLEYFAILPEFQNRGYGTKALKLLKEQSKGYSGIFIEIEKVGLGKDNHENIIREKRKNFYERIGFCKLNFDLELYKVIYTPYLLYTSDVKDNDSKIIDDIFKIYKKMFREKWVNKNYKVIH